MIKKIVVILTVFYVGAMASGSWGAEPLHYVPGEILVKFKSQTAVETLEDRQIMSERRLHALRTVGARIARHFAQMDVYLCRLSEGQTMSQVLEALRANPDVEYAEPNYLRHSLGLVPNDPLYDRQWDLENIHMPEAWTILTGSSNVVLAVTDSGMDLNHEDLQGNIWINGDEVCGNGLDDDGDGYVDNCHGANLVTGKGEPIDDLGHGTHVAGIAGAVGNNGIGIAGVNWQISLMPLKFLDENGWGDVADFIKAVEFAKAHGVKIMNLSVGAYSYSEAEKQAIEGAPNILFIVSAGNERYDNDFHPLYPASYDLPNIISVAASNYSDALASYSNYGKQTVDVAAPGLGIMGTVPGNEYEGWTGTSMAAPLVSGVAAMILAKYPSASVAEIKARLLRTVDVNDGLTNILTRGRINAYRALTEDVSGPYIFGLFPDRGSVGSLVVIRGSLFGSTQGTVVFEGGGNAEIIAWSDDKIVVKVPEGTVAGSVHVETLQGCSNEVTFQVTIQPMGIRYIFPQIRVNVNYTPFLVLSNPLPESVYVQLDLREVTRGEQTLQMVTLEPLEKWVVDLGVFTSSENQSFMLECQTEQLVGAAVVNVGPNLSDLIVIPPIVGRTVELVEGPSR